MDQLPGNPGVGVSVMPGNRPPTGSSGFTLVELAVVLVIVALLVSSLMVPLKTQITIRQVSETRRIQAEIIEALLGFAVMNNRLPCPDTSGDGVENLPCFDGREGWLPSRTIGVGRTDTWGRPFRYRADASFGFTVAVPLDPGTGNARENVSVQQTVTGLTVQNAQTPATVYTDSNPDAAVAIIFSCGRNGVPDLAGTSAGSTADDGNDADGEPNVDADCSNPNLDPSAASVDIPLDALYVQDGVRQGDGNHTEFDDVLVWLPRHVLLERLAGAGRWP